MTTTGGTLTTTDSGSDLVHAALIWFSVGAAVMLLLTVVLILGIITCAKCSSKFTLARTIHL